MLRPPVLWAVVLVVVCSAQVDAQVNCSAHDSCQACSQDFCGWCTSTSKCYEPGASRPAECDSPCNKVGPYESYVCPSIDGTVDTTVYEYFVALKQVNTEKLEAEVLERSDPDSAKYSQWLSHQEIIDMISPPQTAVDEVIKYIESFNATAKNEGDVVKVKATAPQAVGMFGHRLGSWLCNEMNAQRVRHSGPEHAPAHIARHIEFVEGLAPPLKGQYHPPPSDQTKKGHLDSHPLEVVYWDDNTCSGDKHQVSANPGQCSAGFDGLMTNASCHGDAMSVKIYSNDCHGTPDFTVPLVADGKCHTYSSAYLSFSYKASCDGGLFEESSTTCLALPSFYNPDNLTVFNVNEFRGFLGIPDNTTVVDPRATMAVGAFQNQASFNYGDLRRFETVFDLPKANVTYYPYYDGVFPSGESTEDVQIASGIARGASVTWTATGSWIYSQTVNLFAMGDTAPLVHSWSYGWYSKDSDAIEGETNLGSDGTNAIYSQRCNIEVLKLVATGRSVITCSQDEGAYFHGSCDGPFNPVFPGSLPYVTTVGATMLRYPYGQPVSAQQGFEGQQLSIANNGSTTTSGGGFSLLHPQPKWQADAVEGWLTSGVLPPQSYFNASNRGYPDLAALGTALQICEQTACACGARCCNIGDGTSMATPAVAALVTLLNDWRLRNGHTPLGFLNPLLYKMAKDHPQAFHDITHGKNNCEEEGNCCADGYEARKGWDPTSGLGNPNFSQFLTYIQKVSKRTVSGEDMAVDDNDDGTTTSSGGMDGRYKLGAGAVAGIVVSCTVALVAIVAIVVILRRLRTRSSEDGVYHVMQ